MPSSRPAPLRRLAAAVLPIVVLAGTLALPAVPAAADPAPGPGGLVTRLSGGVDEASYTVTAAVGSTVYTAWQDRSITTDGLAGIAFKRSTDSGRTWQRLQDLTWPTGSHGDARHPSITANGDDVHVAWQETTSFSSADRGDESTFVVSSRDRGRTWGKRKRLDVEGDGSHTDGVMVQADGDRVAVAWQDRTRAINVAVSSDAGATFGKAVQVDGPQTGVGLGDVAVRGDDVAVVWSGVDRPAGVTENEIFAATSFDKGATWLPPQNVSKAAGSSYDPEVELTRDGIHVVWAELQGWNELDDKKFHEIRAAHGRDGVAWDRSKLGESSFGMGEPSLTSYGTRLTTAWRDRTTRRVLAATRIGGAWGSPQAVTAQPTFDPPVLTSVPRPDDAVEATFTWTMPDRYGADADGDGIIESAVTAAQVDPGTWQVRLDGCASVVRDGSAPTYRWSLDGEEVSQGRACTEEITFTEEGEHEVTLEVSSDGRVDAVTQTVRVEDRLVVSVGDSVASGEGNPDVPAGPWPWEPASKWKNKQCNRTGLAGPAKAAARLEAADPRSSVTFVHLACSGATVMSDSAANGGLLTAYDGINPEEGEVLQPQMSQLKSLVGDREVDALFISIGANDLHFSSVILECLLRSTCYETDTRTKLEQRFAELPSHYAALSERIDELGIPREKVFITEYFDPTTDATGATTLRCVANNALPGKALTDDETAWARRDVVQKMNAAVQTAAQTHGWNYVGGIAQSFTRRGYCTDNRMVVNLFDSFYDQLDKNGSFHPNGLGHDVYGERISAMVDAAWGPDVVPHEDPDLPTSTDRRGATYLAWGSRNQVVVSTLAHDGGLVSATSSVEVVEPGLFAGGVDLAATADGAWAAWTQAMRNDASVSKYQAYAARVAGGPPNLHLDDVQLVQTSDAPAALTADKATTVRVALTSTLAQQRTIEIGYRIVAADGAVVHDAVALSSVAPGENVLHLAPATPPTLPAGTYTATARLDVPNQVAEKDEGDNEGTSVAVDAEPSRDVSVLYVPLGVPCLTAHAVADGAP
jgi:hypothetical protein